MPFSLSSGDPQILSWIPEAPSSSGFFLCFVVYLAVPRLSSALGIFDLVAAYRIFSHGMQTLS